MPLSDATLTAEGENSRRQWRRVYFWGAAATVAVLLLLVLDIAISNMLGGDISAIPRDAVGRFKQFGDNWLLGLYNHDLLNLVVQIVLLPAYWALYAALRRANRAWAGLALVVYIVGATVFVMSNAALPMLDLSRKYAAAGESARTALTGAGEALLARGAHGSPGALLAFVMPTLAALIMSLAMLGGRVFSRATPYFGLAGNVLLLIYFVLVTFVPGADRFALALAMPGGLLTMAWMFLFARRLFHLAGNNQGSTTSQKGDGKNAMPA